MAAEWIKRASEWVDRVLNTKLVIEIRRPAPKVASCYNPLVPDLQTPHELIEARLQYVTSMINEVGYEQGILSAKLGKVNLKLSNLHTDKLQLQEWLVTHGDD